jgi:hypothetical protein
VPAARSLLLLTLSLKLSDQLHVYVVVSVHPSDVRVSVHEPLALLLPLATNV